MITNTNLCLIVVFSMMLAAFARAEIDTEHRGEIMVEASWYPQTAAYADQKNSFIYLEARPELVIYSDAIEAQVQPLQRPLDPVLGTQVTVARLLRSYCYLLISTDI